MSEYTNNSPTYNVWFFIKSIQIQIYTNINPIQIHYIYILIGNEDLILKHIVIKKHWRICNFMIECR